jgi:hypothetical protein
MGRHGVSHFRDKRKGVNKLQNFAS